MEIAVVGLGKLGSVIAAVYAAAGHRVCGLDISPEIVDKVNNRIAPFPEPGLQELMDQAGANLSASTNFETALGSAEVSYVIVPTPSNSQGTFTNEYVIAALESIGAAIRDIERHHTVIICSTVMPGSCDSELRETLEAASGKSVGKEIGLVYSPEFIALGTIVKNMHFPDLILIGESDPYSGDVATSNAQSVVKNSPSIHRMNLVNAEIVKISINTFVTTKISFANMLGEICDHLAGADVDVITNSVGADSRIGTKYLRGALGYGGPCFPRDNIALTRLAESLGVDAAIPRATDAVNDRQVTRLVQLVLQNTPAEAKVALLGLSYKPDTPVCERSQGIAIANALATHGLQVVVHDPQASHLDARDLLPQITSADELLAAVSGASTVIITTAWPQFGSLSKELLRDKFVVDSWGVLAADIPTVRPGKLLAGHQTRQKETSLA